MKSQDLNDYMGRIASRMRQAANRFPLSVVESPFEMARYHRDDSKTGASLIFSLDCDHHVCGWWKNPDYDRCYHLSLASLGAALSGATTRDISDIPELTRATRERWCRAFFREYCRLLWVEPPFSAEGKRLESHHYRLFVDVSGAPLFPRGEVYSRELTKAGWRSWSDVHGGPS